MNENIAMGSGMRLRRRLCNGQGRGRGYGRGMGGGAVGTCVCPKCGYEEAHQRGNPCFQKNCPKCGEQMIRGS